MTRFMAEAYRDYSETEYVLVAKKVLNTREEAEEFLKDKCIDFQKITELDHANRIKEGEG